MATLLSRVIFCRKDVKEKRTFTEHLVCTSCYVFYILGCYLFLTQPERLVFSLILQVTDRGNSSKTPTMFQIPLRLRFGEQFNKVEVESRAERGLGWARGDPGFQTWAL